MTRHPHKPNKPILTRTNTNWFIITNLMMATTTLTVVTSAEHNKNKQLAHTIKLTTFSLTNLFFSFTARNALHSMFNLKN